MKNVLEEIAWVILGVACGIGVMILGFVIVVGILEIIQVLIG